jgi:hypothetical protein
MTKGKPYKEKIEELKQAIMRKLGNVKVRTSYKFLNNFEI